MMEFRVQKETWGRLENLELQDSRGTQDSRVFLDLREQSGYQEKRVLRGRRG